MRLLRRTARAALVGLTTLVLTAACSGEGVGPIELQGTYELATIDDQPLPYVYSQTSTETSEIVRGWIELHDSGRFSDVIVYRISGPDITPQEQTDEVTGDYEVVGDEILLHDDQGGDYTMLRSGNTLTQSVTSGTATVVFKYTK